MVTMIGLITQWRPMDAIGRIRLDNGVEIKFGKTSAKHFMPREGLRVKVCDLAPHPLGGDRATVIEPLDDPERTHHLQALGIEARSARLHLASDDIEEAIEAVLANVAAPTVDDWRRAAAAGLAATELTGTATALDLARETIVLAPGGTARTRIGGVPELTPEVSWPEHGQRPLSFLAQIVISELPRSIDFGVPRDRVLHVFYNLEELDQGRVIATRDGDAVLPRTPPPGVAQIAPRRLGLRVALTLPWPHRIELEGDEASIYYFVLGALGSHMPDGQIGGHAWPLDGPDLEWCLLLRMRDDYDKYIYVWVPASGDLSRARFDRHDS